jgi:O-antigen/teichoic acid export membrane protein
MSHVREETRANRLRTVRGHLRVPLYANSYALIASGLGSTALGLGFWALAVRFYQPEEIGRASAAISMMTLLAAILQLNLANGVIRFLPEAGNRTAALIRRAYLTCAVTGLIGGAAFTAAVSDRLFFAGLGEHSWALRLLFVAAVPVWSLFVLQDATLTGLRAATVIPVENLVFSVAKIALLVPLAVAPQTGLLIAWIVPALILLVPVNVLVFARFAPRHAAEEPRVHSWKQVRRYLASDYVGGLFETAFVAALPVLVTVKLGLVANAYFYTSWIVVTGLELVLISIGSSLTAEGAHAASATTWLHGRASRMTAAILLPVVVVGLVGAPWLLRIYGEQYAENGTGLFRLLLLAMLFRAVVVLRISLLRIARRGVTIIAYQAANAVLLLAGGLLVLTPWGLTGFGVVFLAVQAVLATAALLPGRGRPRPEGQVRP